VTRILSNGDFGKGSTIVKVREGARNKEFGLASLLGGYLGLGRRRTTAFFVGRRLGFLDSRGGSGYLFIFCFRRRLERGTGTPRIWEGQ
jgi:hypothetical protein